MRPGSNKSLEAQACDSDSGSDSDSHTAGLLMKGTGAARAGIPGRVRDEAHNVRVVFDSLQANDSVTQVDKAACQGGGIQPCIARAAEQLKTTARRSQSPPRGRRTVLCCMIY